MRWRAFFVGLSAIVLNVMCSPFFLVLAIHGMSLKAVARVSAQD
jgi:hypothetical protein